MKRLTLARCLSFSVAGPDAAAEGADGPPAGTPPTPETPPAGTPADDEPDSSAAKTYDAEYVKKLRNEAASHRKAKAELEARLKEIEESNLTTEQKRAKDLKEAQDELNHLRYKARMGDLIDAAVRNGASKPALVAKLIDDGVDDVDAAIASLKKENPELFRPQTPGSADGGTKGKTGTQPSMNDILRSAFNRTTISG